MESAISRGMMLLWVLCYWGASESFFMKMHLPSLWAINFHSSGYEKESKRRYGRAGGWAQQKGVLSLNTLPPPLLLLRTNTKREFILEHLSHILRRRGEKRNEFKAE